MTQRHTMQIEKETAFHAKREQGFSLVELAITLMIIGLLIGLVAKGIELIDNSRVANMVSQVNHYDTAFSAFKKLYGDLPGDIRDGSRIPGCTTAACQSGGNGDGMIANIGGTQWFLAGQAGGIEEYRTWMHLALADLITTVRKNYSGRPLAPGVDYPATALQGGVYDVYYWNPRTATNAPFAFIGGHYLKTKSDPLGTAGGFMRATQAAKVDRKMDDGLPSSGRVLAWRPAPGHCQISGTNRNYPESDKTARCELSFRMNF